MVVVGNNVKHVLKRNLKGGKHGNSAWGYWIRFTADDFSSRYRNAGLKRRNLWFDWTCHRRFLGGFRGFYVKQGYSLFMLNWADPPIRPHHL